MLRVTISTSLGHLGDPDTHRPDRRRVMYPSFAADQRPSAAKRRAVNGLSEPQRLLTVDAWLPQMRLPGLDR